MQNRETREQGQGKDEIIVQKHCIDFNLYLKKRNAV